MLKDIYNITYDREDNGHEKTYVIIFVKKDNLGEYIYNIFAEGGYNVRVALYDGNGYGYKGNIIIDDIRLARAKTLVDEMDLEKEG